MHLRTRTGSRGVIFMSKWWACAGFIAASVVGACSLEVSEPSRFTVPPETIDWLSRNATTLTTTDPSASLTDLEPLRQMIGSAHIVGMGEGTHGTREFFLMKHRILKFLVREMGFTHFAIEATSPEADDVNRYVLTGEGDPRKLLSHLYFWTWNTQEVLDMIEWMREWNSTAPQSQRVQFLGFD